MTTVKLLDTSGNTIEAIRLETNTEAITKESKDKPKKKSNYNYEYHHRYYLNTKEKWLAWAADYYILHKSQIIQRHRAYNALPATKQKRRARYTMKKQKQ